MRTKKTVGIIILVIGIQVTFSQSKNKFLLETKGGYEYNYFRSPEEIRVNNIILRKEDLISSSFSQDIEATYRYRYKSDKNRFRVMINPFSRIFYENLDDSYWSLNVRASYDYKISKNTKLFVESRFLRMNREGLGGDQDVLINPLGYTNYGGSTGISLQPFTNNKITIEGFYNFRNFDAFGVRNLQFDEFGAQVSTVQNFKVNKLKHKLGVTAYAKKRLYDTFNASDIENPTGERDWDYVKGTLFYTLPFSKQFEIKPSFVYYMRIDNSTNRSGFNQYGPGVAMKYDNVQTKIRGAFSFLTRDYSAIEARNTEAEIGEKLKYEYAIFSLNVTQKIMKRVSLRATVSSRIRETNYTDIDARSFRNYKNQYAGVSILVEF